MPHDERQGRKPYKTYKAGRRRPNAVDRELAASRPSRQGPAAHDPPDGGRGNGSRGRGQAPPGAASSRANGGARYTRYAGEAASEPRYTRYAGGAVGQRSAADAEPRRATPKHRRLRWWHLPLILVLVLAIAAIVAVVLAWPGYKTLDRAVAKANERLGDGARSELAPDAGWVIRKPTTILLLGVDSKAGEPARSDSILLMRFDPRRRTINQLAIPRDTRVVIPGRGEDKINEAMFWGMIDGHGPELALRTVKHYLDIPINHIMIVNFKGFPRLVNAVGGVDMYVPKTVTTTAGSKRRPVTFSKGRHHFDGKNAMLYVRIRKVDNDFERARRQQQFLQALQKKIAQPSSIMKAPEIGKRFMSGVATDLSTNQLLALAFLKWRAKGGSKQVLAGEPAYIGGVAYVLPPPQAERQRMIDRFMGR